MDTQVRSPQDIMDEIATLAAEAKMTGKDVARAIKQYKIESEKPNPVGV